MAPHDHNRRRYVAVIAAAVVVMVLVIARSCSTSPSGEPSAPPRDEPQGAERTPDERSAAAAGVEYATGPQQWLYLTDEEVEAAVRALAAPDRADDLADAVVEDIRDAREGLSGSSGPVWWIVRPLAVHVEDLSEDRATVKVWVVTVLSARDVAAPQAEWRTISLNLVWADDAWKVDAIRDTPGPTPMIGPGDRPWDAVPFDDALESFERLDGEVVR